MKNVKDIHYINPHQAWVVIPSPAGRGRRSRRIKKLFKTRGNCFFAPGVPARLMPFIYRCTVMLDLKKKRFLFSRGAVKVKGRSVKNALHVRELEWDVGTSILIPRNLKQSEDFTAIFEGETVRVNFMELLLLQALLRFDRPHKSRQWYSEKALAILVRGWKVYRN